MKLDLMERVNDKINSLGLFAHSRIGVLDTEASIAIMAMPGGDEVVYLDGVRDKTQNIQINAKGMDQQQVLDALTIIYQELEQLSDLKSLNESYDFQFIKTASYPSLLIYDEKGYFIYELSISAHITIYKGVY